jgi:hypothetical protein
MRRLLGSGLLLLTLTASLTAPAAVAAAPDHGRPAVSHAAPTALERRAASALRHAQDALAGRGGDATMELASLRAAYPHLSSSQRRQANALLARPTDGANDPYGTGYDYTDARGHGAATDATPECGVHFCIHYVTGSDDQPTDLTDANKNTFPDYVDAVLARMESVWTYEVGTRGYRAPATDGKTGGDARMDIYLANVSAQRLYGYCAPDTPVPGQQWRAAAFCVLDNDFVGFPTSPEASLKVTAAHEFFHTIQFNYDAGEDHWIMEATATWMEERYADEINDNRQYLPASQMHKPGTPLDTFSDNGEQYGNWIFFERLTHRYGYDAVKRMWQLMDASKGAPDLFSVAAVQRVLEAKKTTFPRFYAQFAMGNLLPRFFYTEGSHYGAYAAPLTDGWGLTPKARGVRAHRYGLQHLTSKSFGFMPDPQRMRARWTLTITVNGPDTSTGAAAEVLIVRRDGGVGHKPVILNAHGDGKIRLLFDARKVKVIGLTLVDASTDYVCWKHTGWACQGQADPARAFTISASARR